MRHVTLLPGEIGCAIPLRLAPIKREGILSAPGIEVGNGLAMSWQTKA